VLVRYSLTPKPKPIAFLWVGQQLRDRWKCSRLPRVAQNQLPHLGAASPKAHVRSPAPSPSLHPTSLTTSPGGFPRRGWCRGVASTACLQRTRRAAHVRAIGARTDCRRCPARIRAVVCQLHVLGWLSVANDSAWGRALRQRPQRTCSNLIRLTCPEDGRKLFHRAMENSGMVFWSTSPYGVACATAWQQLRWARPPGRELGGARLRLSPSSSESGIQRQRGRWTPVRMKER